MAKIRGQVTRVYKEREHAEVEFTVSEFNLVLAMLSANVSSGDYEGWRKC